MIKNITNGKIISKNFKLCNTIWLQAKGLMFCNKVEKPLVFEFKKEKKVSLHMWFVFCPIDVVYLNKNKKIIEIKENFKPWTFYNPTQKAKYVIEFEKGIVNKTEIKLQDVIEF